MASMGLPAGTEVIDRILDTSYELGARGGDDELQDVLDEIDVAELSEQPTAEVELPEPAADDDATAVDVATPEAHQDEAPAAVSDSAEEDTPSDSLHWVLAALVLAALIASVVVFRSRRKSH